MAAGIGAPALSCARRFSLSRGRKLLYDDSVYRLGFVLLALAAVAAGQTIPGSFAQDLREFVATPAPYGYETALADHIAAELASLSPQRDALGDVIVRLSPPSGSPPDATPQVLATSLSTPGFVVSGVTSDGYLRLQSLPFPNPEPLFNALRNAQPVEVQTRSGNWINGVIAGISVHLQRGRAQVPDPNDLDNLYVDIGATSAANVAEAGVEILSPVVLDRRLYTLQNGYLTAAGIAGRYGSAALVEVLRRLDPAHLPHPLIVAFVNQNDRGLARLMQMFPAAELTWIGGGALPRRFQNVARAQVEVDFPGTPAEMLDGKAVAALVTRLETALGQTPEAPALPPPAVLPEPALPVRPAAAPTPEQVLPELAAQYGVNPHEQQVRAAIQALLPPWAHPSVDAAGNLLLHWGDAGSNAPRLLFIAHMDEIGFDVTSIAADGRLVLRSRGGGDLNYYLGHPILVHAASGMIPGVLELPPGWQQRGFTLTGLRPSLRADIGARSPAEVASLGIQVGDSVTVPKRYRQLLNGRATTRAFDDRVGDTALVAAAWALGESLPGRDVTFAWSAGEEIGLVGATALAQQLANAGRTPTYVFAIDTFVSSDSPLESHRFADTPIGEGFVIRAIDNSSLDPWPLARRLQDMARQNRIPAQLGITGGGNDGSVFTPYGAVDLPLGWPLRTSHSPGEVIATRDLDALTHMLTLLARSW